MLNYFSGNLFIVSAPSGGGKTSLVKELVKSLEKIAVSISHTTRKIRPREKCGIDYFFLDETDFMRMIANNDFIEYAQVFDYFYGTSAAQITERLQAGIDVVLDIDWQGAQQIRRAFGDAVSIFVIPPSLDALRQRLMNRRQDDASTITIRMQQACDELSHYPEFDYLIVNDDFAQAASELKSIVIANRLQMSRQREQQRQLLTFLLS